MAQALLLEDLRSLIEAHLPPHHRSAKSGRASINGRAAPTGILFVNRTGIPWEYLPGERGCGRGMTCWRRLHEWIQAGIWQSGREAVLRRLREHDQIMWDRACADAASVPAPAHRAGLRRRGISARIACYGMESRERLGLWRWVVERTIGWIYRFRRLRIRHERRADIYRAFVSLAVLSSVGGMSEGSVRRSKFRERLAEAGIRPSMGSKSDIYENALAETINWLYNAELIHLRAPWKTREAVK